MMSYTSGSVKPDLQSWGSPWQPAVSIVVCDMVNNNNNDVSKILIVGNQNPPIKTRENKKGNYNLFCPGWAQQTDKKKN